MAYDDRFNLVTASGTGTGIHSFQISAFRRPKPVHYSLADIRSRVGESSEMLGKAVFISGASRGFGGVLARAFALQGANLALNYRSSSLEAHELEKEIRFLPVKVLPCLGDVSSEEDCKRMKDAFFLQFGRLDFLICNAFPKIEARQFLAQTPVEFLDFIQRALAASSKLLHSFLPQMEPGAIVIHISTIFTVKPSEQFSHYVAAKSAVEGLLRVLALEFKSIRFVIVRPPRMLTDSTNLTYDLNKPVSAVDVAAKLLEALREIMPGRNLFEVNL